MAAAAGGWAYGCRSSGTPIRLLVLAATLLPSTSRLVFDSVSHLGGLPGARADADFLLSFFEVDALGTRFVVGAPQASLIIPQRFRVGFGLIFGGNRHSQGAQRHGARERGRRSQLVSAEFWRNSGRELRHAADGV